MQGSSNFWVRRQNAVYHETNFKWILLGTFFLMALLVQCSFSKRNFAFDIENIIFSVLCVIPIFSLSEEAKVIIQGVNKPFVPYRTQR